MIFVDSNALVALYNINHSLHQKALSISRHLQQNQDELITTNIVIAEAFTIISMRVSKMLAITFGKEITNNGLPLVYIDEQFHQRAWEIFQKIKSKNVSFFDCTSFAVMEYLNIRKAFSFDEDFQGYGFELAD